MVFFIEWHVYKQQWHVKYVIFWYHEKLQSKVSKPEVWCEIISAFRCKDYCDIACQRLWKLVEISPSYSRLSSGHIDTVYLPDLYIWFLFYVIWLFLSVHNVDRCRLRRKSWKNPGRIYANDAAALDDGVGTICSDLIFEVLDGRLTF